MSRRDGTGPLGQGAMTGRGLGLCNISSAPSQDISLGRRLSSPFGNFGLGRGRGFGLRLGFGQRLGRRDPENKQQILSLRKKQLEEELRWINKGLKRFSD